MTSADDLLAALPIREIRVRAGSYGNCGGVIIAVADLERGSTEGVEVVDAVTELPDWSTDFPDDVDLCVHSIGRGAKAALVDRFGGEPPVRLVLRGLRFSPVDMVAPVGRTAGRLVVTEAIRRAGHDDARDDRRLPRPATASRAVDDMRDRPSRPWHRRLRVPLGVREDGTPLVLDLKEPAQGGMGPHGLCVGGHAADGNPVVRSVLSGLTASHSPDELALLLLGNDSDAGFAPYAALPHTTTVVAGLRSEPAAVRRARDAMSTALDARRRLLDDKDSTTHTDYETARMAGEPLPPLPSLLVVVDGFSDLVGADPDLLATLVALGRSGRALGVHLLAVTDGMEPGRVRGLDGFLSYRIAMRTRDETESRIAIGVPDAHRLPEAPGHAYLRHGTEALVPFRLGT